MTSYYTTIGPINDKCHEMKLEIMFIEKRDLKLRNLI